MEAGDSDGGRATMNGARVRGSAAVARWQWLVRTDGEDHAPLSATATQHVQAVYTVLKSGRDG